MCELRNRHSALSAVRRLSGGRHGDCTRALIVLVLELVGGCMCTVIASLLLTFIHSINCVLRSQSLSVQYKYSVSTNKHLILEIPSVIAVCGDVSLAP